MALSKVDSGIVTKESTDGLEPLRRSLQYFRDGLMQFRVCHDLCSTSELLDSQASCNLDQCAIDFRQISFCVASLAEKVASLWCKTCTIFYKNFDKIKGNPKKVLESIAQQAGELNKGFKHIKERAGKLAMEFSSIKLYPLPVHQQFVKAFENKSNAAIKEETMMENRHITLTAEKERKIEELRKFQQFQQEAKKSMEEKSSLLKRQKSNDAEYRDTFFKEQELRLQKEIKNVEDMEKECASNLQKIQALVEKCKDQESKAKVCAEELYKLMQILKNVEAMSEEIAKYWDDEQNYYTKLSTDDLSELKEKITEEEIKKQAETLPKQKELMEAYHKSMIIVNNSCNFPTKLQPSPLPTEFFLPKIQITWK